MSAAVAVGLPFDTAMEMDGILRLAYTIAIAEIQNGKSYDFDALERRLREG